jgi:hypothetical protein
VLGYVPPCKTLTVAILKDLGFGGGPKRGPQASRTPHTLPPRSEKGLNKFQIQESYDQRLHLVADWRTPSPRTGTSLQNQLQVYRVKALEIMAQWQVKLSVPYWLGEKS